MTSKLDFPIPEWRKAWKLDDPEWVKARRQAWRRIKQSPLFEMFERRELKRIKNFFMTGSAFDPEPPEEEWRWYRYHPDKRPVPVSNSVLIECWLGADQSETHWQEIKTKYSEGKYESSRRFFRQCLRNRFPEQGPLFDGLDERLYYFFEPTRCRPADYPDLNYKDFIYVAWRVNNDLENLIKAHLSEHYNPHNIAPAVLPEWCDSVSFTYEAVGPEREEYVIRNMAGIAKNARDIVDSQEDFRPEQVGFARDVLTRFKQMELPEPLEKALEPILE
jgi:hypothetical protein